MSEALYALLGSVIALVTYVLLTKAYSYRQARRQRAEEETDVRFVHWAFNPEYLPRGSTCICEHCEGMRRELGLMPAEHWRKLKLPSKYV